MTKVTEMTQRLRRKPSLEEAPLQGELMLFDPASANFYVLNRTMAFTWRRIEETPSAEAIAAELEKEFAGVNPKSASADIQKAIDDLLALGLLQET